MRRALAVLLLAGLLAGCAQRWAKPGGTPAQLDAAKANCDSEAYTRFPPMMQTVMVSAGYQAPLRTECRQTPQGQRCVTVGGEYVPPSYSTEDLNSRPRFSAFNACMMKGGWTLARDKDEAEMITNSGPVPAKAAPPGGDARLYCDDVFHRRPNAALKAVFKNNYETCLSVRRRELKGS